MGDWQPIDKTYGTRAIHEFQRPEQWSSKAITTPIVLSSTFLLDEDSKINMDHFYSRYGNPTRAVLEKTIASLDDGKYALTYASGMAAVTSAIGILKAGDHISCSSDVYGGTHKMFSDVATQHGLDVSFFKINTPNGLEESIKNNTKMIWIETPSNPLGKIVDIRATANICKKHGVMLVIDNTFQTSYFQKPLNLGADIVMYSLTKYMNGHADVIMGALVTNNDEVYKQLKHLHIYMGNTPSPFDCYLVSRGLKTLPLRMKQHMSNAMTVTSFLQKHPLVEKVEFAGLPDHPQHELLKSQASGICGLFSFYIKNATLNETIKFLNNMKLIINAGSLGGVESLAISPVIISHFAVPKEERIKLGITDNLIRVSVGIEEAEELCKDIDQALWAAFGKTVDESVKL